MLNQTSGNDRITGDSLGINTDNTIGLQWIVHPDSSSDWNAASVWVNSLGGDWRMPSLDELQELYNAGKIDEVYIWSGQTEDPLSAWYLACFDGGFSYPRDRTDDNLLAVAVRSVAVQDARFSIDIQRIITDNVTGLEWFVYNEDPGWRPEFGTYYSWVNQLGAGWRLPTVFELQELYEAGITSDQWGYFQYDLEVIWSDEFESPGYIFAVDFSNGEQLSAHTALVATGIGAFAVRGSPRGAIVMDDGGY